MGFVACKGITWFRFLLLLFSWIDKSETRSQALKDILKTIILTLVVYLKSMRLSNCLKILLHSDFIETTQTSQKTVQQLYTKLKETKDLVEMSRE